ncbi:STAS domain-containing protein [Fundidesulfovibrio soli]|uniref:STAS domain-containing protein n=1 Tax=Fundidesulfovibrio soli TaxID=2922716 RepID=UPI001FAF8BFB
MENLIWLRKGACLLAKFSGEITMEVTQDFKHAVEQALEKDDSQALALDLSEVSFMDSSGIGFLVSCNTRLQSLGKRLVLMCPSPQVRKTLGLVQLMDFFAVAESDGDLESLTAKGGK